MYSIGYQWSSFATTCQDLHSIKIKRDNTINNAETPKTLLGIARKMHRQIKNITLLDEKDPADQRRKTVLWYSVLLRVLLLVVLLLRVMENELGLNQGDGNYIFANFNLGDAIVLM